MSKMTRPEPIPTLPPALYADRDNATAYYKCHDVIQALGEQGLRLVTDQELADAYFFDRPDPFKSDFFIVNEFERRRHRIRMIA